MDELDDLAAFGLAEVDEDRAAGEWDDPHAPAVGEVLTTAQAVELARVWGAGATVRVRVGSRVSIEDVAELKALIRYVLAVAPVVAAAREWAAWMGDSDGRWGNGAELLDALEAAVRALDGDA